MPDIIIHGASSFLGKHFSRRLISDGYSLTIVARENSNISFAKKNNNVKILRYQNSLDEINPSQIACNKPAFFEFSWHGVFGTERNNPEQLTINIPLMLSSINLANKVKAAHWIGFGSQAEYGNLDKKISETDTCNPVTVYGKSKYFCSAITSELCKAYNIHHSWLRLFSVYGPDDNHEWLIQYLIKKMLANESIDVTKGEQTWDYLYVEDITNMLMKLMGTSGCGIANLGSGTGIRVKDIIELIKELTGSSSPINYGALPYRPDQVMQMQADISRLSSAVDWKPETSIREGLSKTIASLKSTFQN
jgi:UDP-glucose 4-epimerase